MNVLEGDVVEILNIENCCPEDFCKVGDLGRVVYTGTNDCYVEVNGAGNYFLYEDVRRINSPTIDEADIDAMVARFLAWHLPEDFNPDGGISFDPYHSVDYMARQGKPPLKHNPTGTNLLDYEQAKAMIKHILGKD